MASHRGRPNPGTSEGQMAIAEEALQIVDHLIGYKSEAGEIHFDPKARPFGRAQNTQLPAHGHTVGNPVIGVGLG